MRLMTTRLRGLLIALVVLALSASVAFAGGIMPSAADHGLTTASENAGFEVPVGASEDEDGDEDVDEDEDEDDGDEDTDEDTDEDADDEDGDVPSNHGELVSAAAQMDLPLAFTDEGLNHGAFVRCVARMNRGHLDPEAEPMTVDDLAALTPDDCDGDDEATDGDEDDADATLKGKDKHEAKVKAAKAKGKKHNR